MCKGELNFMFNYKYEFFNSLFNDWLVCLNIKVSFICMK